MNKAVLTKDDWIPGGNKERNQEQEKLTTADITLLKFR
jgi:hypothetical protein